MKPHPELLKKHKTFPEQLKAWLDIGSRMLSPRTIYSYNQVIREFFNAVGKKSVADIVKADALTYIDFATKKGHHEYTIKNRLVQAQGFCRFYGIDPKFDIPRVRRKREEDIRKQLISPEELNAFLTNCQTPRDRAIASILWETGIRASELLGIKWKNLDFKKMTVYIEQRKGGNSQTLPFGDLTLSTLTEWKNATPASKDNDHVFVSLTKKGYGKPLHRNGLSYVIKSVGERAGWKKEQMHPHAFRHSFATYAQTGEHRLTPFQVQSALGHSDIQTTAIYTRVLESDLTDAYARRYRSISKVGIKDEGVEVEAERCPDCEGVRLPWHRVCPCGHDYSQEDTDDLKKEVDDLRQVVNALVFALEQSTGETIKVDASQKGTVKVSTEKKKK
jgi:integrase/recombinase XerD